MWENQKEAPICQLWHWQTLSKWTVLLRTRKELTKPFLSHVQMWELDHKKGWAWKNWCSPTMVLEKTLESPSQIKEIKPVHPTGNQLWIFIGRTDAEAPILQLPDLNSQLVGKDPDAGRDWWQEKKRVTEDEMVGWHHWLSRQEFEQIPEDGEIKKPG